MILPGVQVLFAFLLVVPFNQRFADVTTFQKDLYLATLLCAAAASACLIAPVDPAPDHLPDPGQGVPVFRANRLVIVGGGLLAVAMTGAIWLITGFLFGDAITAAAVVVVAGLFAALWFGVPLARRIER